MSISNLSFKLSVCLTFLLFACNNDQTKSPSATFNPPNVTGIGNIVLPEGEAKRYIENFEKVFKTKGGSKNDSLSVAVWFDKKVIHFLDSVLQKEGSVDGVRAYFAAYDKFMPGVSGQKYTNQATLIFVATTPNETYHKDNWKVIPEYVPFGGLNHGSLCPNDCTTQ